MLRRLLPLALTAALFCPMTSFAQTAADPTPPVAPAAPAPAAPAKSANRVSGKISSVDAAAKTITVSHGKKSSLVVSVPDGTKIYKADDAKGSPTGTFADLTLDTRVTIKTNGDETTPVAKTIHIRAPKTAGATTPAVP